MLFQKNKAEMVTLSPGDICQLLEMLVIITGESAAGALEGRGQGGGSLHCNAQGIQRITLLQTLTALTLQNSCGFPVACPFTFYITGLGPALQALVKQARFVMK